jgi:hypothetical protein
MIRRAKAVWRGPCRAGSGRLSTDSGVLVEKSSMPKSRLMPSWCELCARSSRGGNDLARRHLREPDEPPQGAINT